MKKRFVKILAVAGCMMLLGILQACGQNSEAEIRQMEKENSIVESNIVENSSTEVSESVAAAMEDSNTDITSMEENAYMRIKVTVGDIEMYADLEDNAFTREWIKQLPVTLSMSDLYGREMCYRYGANAFPTDTLRIDGYEVGDIAYWPPRGSLVILYEQNGEEFERQQVGHISSGADIFKTTGDVDITFEMSE